MYLVIGIHCVKIIFLLCINLEIFDTYTRHAVALASLVVQYKLKVKAYEHCDSHLNASCNRCIQ